MNFLVTGATGFVGRFLCELLLAEGGHVKGTLLSSENPIALPTGVEPAAIDPLGPDTSWRQAMTGVDTVVHLAARVHVMNDRCDDPLAEYRRVNVEGTRRLAREAAGSGVRRLVFISSVKVNGEETPVPYAEDSPVNPTDPYGISKWEAEQALREIGQDTGLEVVVVRPPLVYGPGVKANFLSMMKLVHRNVPLPLSRIHNRRSFIYVRNLVDALALCSKHPAAAGETYLVHDGEAMSTQELVRRIAFQMDQRARLYPFPSRLLKVCGSILGKSALVERLMGSLEVDSSKICRDLGWLPPYTMEQGLKETVQWFMLRRK